MFKKLLVVAIFSVAGIANAVVCSFHETLVMGHNGEQVIYQTMSYRDLDSTDVIVLKGLTTPFITTMNNQKNKGGNYIFNYQAVTVCGDSGTVYGPDIFLTGFKKAGQEKVWNSYFNTAKQKTQYIAN